MESDVSTVIRKQAVFAISDGSRILAKKKKSDSVPVWIVSKA